MLKYLVVCYLCVLFLVGLVLKYVDKKQNENAFV